MRGHSSPEFSFQFVSQVCMFMSVCGGWRGGGSERGPGYLVLQL